MDIKNTGSYPKVPNIAMMVYGMGGVGKSTFGSTFPKPLMLDFENGAKYFGERGIKIDVATFKNWLTTADKKELAAVIENYETIIVDPIGEAMEKLINDKDSIAGSKYRQNGGDLTMAGWGEVKNQMRTFIKWLRDSGKNVLIVAHVDEKDDEGTLVKRPLIATKLSEELVAMVDIVGYMTVVERDGETVRVIQVDGSNSKVISKDRTGKLGKIIKPEYSYIMEQLGGKVDAAGKEGAKAPAKKAAAKKTAAKK